MHIILDSNIFDDLLDGKISVDEITNESIHLYVTHIQFDELNKCPDDSKREKLLSILNQVEPNEIGTESFVFGTSRLGKAKLGDGLVFEQLRKGKMKWTNDALIGETAIKNNFILLTNDRRLNRNVIDLGGKTTTIDALKAFLHKPTVEKPK